MIPLALPARAEAEAPFVTRLALSSQLQEGSSILVYEEAGSLLFAGEHGLVEILGAPAGAMDGDIVLVNPAERRVDRLIRANSKHNTLLVTECCDQLCVMCSQPPKKTHHDRFEHFRAACLLAREGETIGLSGGEPTLFKERLLSFLEDMLAARPDLSFHILSNGQHFEESDVDRLAAAAYRKVVWGIPLYSADPAEHDRIVAKPGAFERLERSLAHLILAAARVELRTVLLQANWQALPALAVHIGTFLRFIEQWSIMQVEHVGFARNRWAELYVDHSANFGPLGEALDLAVLTGVRPALFNFPRCTVPEAYRRFALASISDWKQKFAPACGDCAERSICSGFFEWHPEALLEEVQPL